MMPTLRGPGLVASSTTADQADIPLLLSKPPKNPTLLKQSVSPSKRNAAFRSALEGTHGLLGVSGMMRFCLTLANTRELTWMKKLALQKSRPAPLGAS